MSRQTACDYVAAHLRREILGGHLEPGAKLGVVELARELEVSQTPVREAFQVLAKDGLVKLAAYRGASVAELSADEYEEIFVMRVALEELAARKGTEAIDDDGIEEMRRGLEAMRKATKAKDPDAFIVADRAFHKALYTAPDRPSLWERIMSLRRAAERYTRIAYRLPDIGMPETVESHSRIFDAVVARDADAACAALVQDFHESFGPIYAELAPKPAVAA